MKFTDMKDTLYYGLIFLMFLICFIGGATIKDLGPVFEILAAFANSQIGYIWPGLFYFITEYKYIYEPIENRSWHRFNGLL